MSPFKTFPFGAAAVLAMAAPDVAAGSWRLTCDGDGLAPLCAALAAAVSSDAEDAGDLRFVAETQAAAHLTGHLAWTRADGTAGRGPSLTLSASDSDLTPEMLRGFAADLLTFGGPPLPSRP